MNEKEKYMSIYAGELGRKMMSEPAGREYRDGGYGRGCWGEGILPFLKTQRIRSLCDVGCGYGLFCDKATNFIPDVYGVDIASVASGNVVDNPKIKFIDAEAKNIPLHRDSVEWVTSFDCLEHCKESDVDQVFEEFQRIAVVGWIFSIAYCPDIRVGVTLHMTVKPESWWIKKIEKYGKISKAGKVPSTGNPYLVCNLAP